MTVEWEGIAKNEFNNRNNSWINSYIEDCYSGIEKTTLTGNYNPNSFTTKRIIVIQMK